MAIVCFDESDTGALAALARSAATDFDFGRAIEAEWARQAQPGSGRSPRARSGKPGALVSQFNFFYCRLSTCDETVLFRHHTNHRKGQ
jgi:hypothetical protein